MPDAAPSDTTPTAPARRGPLLKLSRSRPRWRAFVALLRSETLLFLRDGPTAVFALLVPPLVLLGAGLAIPGMRDTITDTSREWLGLTLIQAYTPTVLTMALVTPALSALPVAVATHRERGVLRRLATTPTRPSSVLLVQVAISLVAFLAASLMTLLVSRLAFDTPLPRRPAVACLALTMGAIAVLGLGLLVAARARTASAATSTGMLLYFPLLFLAGMWTPGPLTPDLVAAVATYTPVGALSQALNMGWFTTQFPLTQLLVLTAWSAACFPLAARLFRWS
ncbi:ABC transporter permease [Phycicoccus sp. MAQZ13P-2]|uniref:ABC transporter permease n=1 Tax=Phycicoccus mangrovi TaxID=2840470 RepID=UPI001C00374E|nr:ABC transporter permease [Phycicoccus mangrovi]MBT9256290.1 ABC transporter permease [Phycicoccus mangrovi]MBT9273714.1 ABC transporter permease [Phycicoccus mangrovi]